MKKSIIPALLVVGGLAAAYFLKKSKEKNEDKTLIQIHPDDGVNNSEAEEMRTWENTQEAARFESEEDILEEHVLEHENEEEQPVYSDEVREINLMYPYLKPNFISKVLKDVVKESQSYRPGELVRVSHDISFAIVEDLIAFVRIIKEHDYQISEADGDQSLTINKDILVEDGKVLSDILNVSNQVACLNGTYKGYNITTK